MPMNETVHLGTRDGRRVAAEANITRYNEGQRLARALPVAIGGISLGAVSILVPAVHLISTWLLPLLGIFIASYIYKTTMVVGRVATSCPDCSAEVAIDKAGSVDDEPLWLRCPSCKLPLAFDNESVGAPQDA